MMDWAKVKAVFDAALHYDSSQHAAFLAEACGGDEALRAEVEKLLRAHAAADTAFLEKPALAATASLVNESDEAPQQRIGPYKIVRELGRGGMGAVYLAERADGEYRKQVAIKLLPTGGDEQLIARFRRERQILADLDHPNIARLLDGGTEDGRPYVVMEYVAGRSLRTLLQEQGALPLDKIVALTQQICAGLAAAHRCGIVHRDIKPENLIVAEREDGWFVKILDFGIARVSGGADGNRTKTGVVMGTAAYMSPEQAAGVTHGLIDARSDIYSLGLVIYEMLTGSPAFTGDSLLAVIAKQIHEAPLPPSRLRADAPVPPALERVVLRALEKQRERRQETADQLAAELQQAYGEHLASPAQPRRRRMAGALLIAAIITIVALLGWKFSAASFSGVAPKPQPSTVAAAPLTGQYRVLRQAANGETKPLAPDGFVRSGDVVRFEVTMPWAGAFYLLQHNDDGTLVWANPLPGGAAQRGETSQVLSAPAGKGIPLGPTPGRQIYEAIYVPVGHQWAIKAPVHKISHPFPDGRADVLYAEISAPAAAKLLAALNDPAIIHHPIIIEQRAQ